jgi:hypothetical protein
MNQWDFQKKLGSILVRPEYLDITGSVVAGMLLSQIAYWSMPKKFPHLNRVQREGKMWIAKTRREWRAELRLSEWEFRVSLERLVSLGLVQTESFKFDFVPKLHLWLDVELLREMVTPGLSEKATGGYPEAEMPATVSEPQHPHGVSLKTPLEESSSSYIEESNTESNTEKTAFAQAQNPGVTMATLKDLHLQKNMEKASPSILWRKYMAEVYGGFQAPLTMKEQGQLKGFVTYVVGEGKKADAVIEWVIREWATCAIEIRVALGLPSVPTKPVIGWCLQYKAEVLNVMEKYLTPAVVEKPVVVEKVVQSIAEDDKPSEDQVASAMKLLGIVK